MDCKKTLVTLLVTLSVCALAFVHTNAATGTSGIQPDLYTVVWLTGDYRFGFGGLIFGRSGDVKKGVPGTNIWPGGADPS